MEFMVPIAPNPSLLFDSNREDKSLQSFEGGWLQQFFDSAFFCEWIAVTYLYKQDNEGVREYLCKRMYTLPEEGIQDYLFQLCYLAVHKPCKPLEKYLVDVCRHSLHASLRLHWFLLAELADLGKDATVLSLQASCLEAAMLGALPLLKCPRPPRGPSSSQRMLQMVSVASRRFLPLSKQQDPSVAVAVPEAGGPGSAAVAPEGGATVTRRFIALTATSSVKAEQQQGQQPQQQQEGKEAKEAPVSAASQASSAIISSASAAAAASSAAAAGVVSISSAAASSAAAAASSAAAAALSGLPLKAFSSSSSAKASGASAEPTESTLSRLKNLMPQSTRSRDGAGPSSATYNRRLSADGMDSVREGAALLVASPPVSPTHANITMTRSGIKSESVSPSSSACSTPQAGHPDASPTRWSMGPLFRMASGGEIASPSGAPGEEAGAKTGSGDKATADASSSRDTFLRALFWRLEEHKSSTSGSGEGIESPPDPETPGQEARGQGGAEQQSGEGDRKSPAESSPTEYSWLPVFKERQQRTAEAGESASGEAGSGKESSLFWRFFRSRGEEGEQDEEERQRALVVGELGVLPEGDESEALSATSSQADLQRLSRQPSCEASLASSVDTDGGKDSFLWRMFSHHRTTASADGAESALSGEEDEAAEGFFRKLLHARSGSPAPQATEMVRSSSLDNERDAASPVSDGGSVDHAAGSIPPGTQPGNPAECDAQSERPAASSSGPSELDSALCSIERTMLASFLSSGDVAQGVDSVGFPADKFRDQTAYPGSISAGSSPSPLPSHQGSASPMSAHASSGAQVPAQSSTQSREVLAGQVAGPAVVNEGLLKRLFQRAGSLSESAAAGAPPPDQDSDSRAGSALRSPASLSDVDESEFIVSPKRGHERSGSIGARFMGTEGGLFSKMFRGKGDGGAKAAELLIEGSDPPSGAPERKEDEGAGVPGQAQEAATAAGGGPTTANASNSSATANVCTGASAGAGTSSSLFRKFWSAKGQEPGAQAQAQAQAQTQAQVQADLPAQGGPVSGVPKVDLEAPGADTRRGLDGASEASMPKIPKSQTPDVGDTWEGEPQEGDAASTVALKESLSNTSEQHRRTKSGGEAVEAGKQVLQLLYRNTVASAAGAASGARGLVEEAASLVRGKQAAQQASGTGLEAGGEQPKENGVSEARDLEGAQGGPAQVEDTGAKGSSKDVPNGNFAKAGAATPEGGLLKRLYDSALGGSNSATAPAEAVAVHVNGTAPESEGEAPTETPQVPGEVASKQTKASGAPRFIRRLFEDKEPRPSSADSSEEGSSRGTSAPMAPIPLVDAPAPAPVPVAKPATQGYRITSLVGGSLFGSAAKPKAPEPEAKAAPPETDAAGPSAPQAAVGAAPSAASRAAAALAEPHTGLLQASGGAAGNPLLVEPGHKALEITAPEPVAAVGGAGRSTESTSSSPKSSGSAGSSTSASSGTGSIAFGTGTGSSTLSLVGLQGAEPKPEASLLLEAVARTAEGRAAGSLAEAQARGGEEAELVKAVAAAEAAGKQPKDSKELALLADDSLPYPKEKLPKYPAFTIRKDTICATLDFVKALGDISLGLVDVFPHAHRVAALQESLSELNAHLAQMSSSEGVFFPMGKGLLRIVRIPEEEAVLLSSRERVPFMMFVEVLNCEPLGARKKDQKANPKKLAKSGIPLSSGQTAPVLPRPPPWALHMWSTRGTIESQSALSLSRTLSDLALDRAMASLYSRMKVVGVSLEVRKKPRDRKGAGSGLLHSSSSRRSPTECCSCDPIPREAPGCAGEEALLGQGGAQPHEAQEGLQGAAQPVESQTASRAQPPTATGAPTPTPTGAGAAQQQTCSRCSLPLPSETSHGPPGASDIAEDALSEAETEDGEEHRSEGWAQFEEYVSVKLVAVPGVTVDDVASVSLAEQGEHRRVPSSLAIAHVRESTEMGTLPPIGVAMKNPPQSPRSGHPLDERMEDRKARIRKTSKFGTSPDWDLKCVIVKSGDDCRQEHLALQLVSHFRDIFQEAGLPLWLRPYEILVTSSRTALIETVTDSVSLHTLKGRYPAATSLRDYFEIKYEGAGSPAFRAAQQNFVESMAAYSIVSYFLQLKDRHNGNVLLDDDGHVIHIDFGFMLSNSPGGVNFENAPFKLTREMLEVMDSDAEGTPSEAFDYFKVLCIQGFLTCRKQSERILLLVEMMQRTRCPCFKAGTRVVHHLKKRFHLTLTEEQCVSTVLSLISKSVDSWRTRQYDYYQKVLNGIL